MLQGLHAIVKDIIFHLELSHLHLKHATRTTSSRLLMKKNFNLQTSFTLVNKCQLETLIFLCSLWVPGILTWNLTLQKKWMKILAMNSLNWNPAFFPYIRLTHFIVKLQSEYWLSLLAFILYSAHFCILSILEHSLAIKLCPLLSLHFIPTQSALCFIMHCFVTPFHSLQNQDTQF